MMSFAALVALNWLGPVYILWWVIIWNSLRKSMWSETFYRAPRGVRDHGGRWTHEPTIMWKTFQAVWIILISFLVSALWPLYRVVYPCCPSMDDALVELLKPPRRPTPSQDPEDNTDWDRRGWIVLLRARHQRVSAARRSSSWTGCGTKRVTGHLHLLMGVASLSGDEHDLEGGQACVEHKTLALEFQQLISWVVGYQEDGVFRTIVGYL